MPPLSPGFTKRCVGIIVFGFAVLLVALGLFRQRPPPPVPLPNPNGYDDFVKAAGLRTGQAFASTNISSLHDFVSSNAEALRLVRLGLTRDCRLPVVYSRGYGMDQMKQVTDFKALTMTMLGEGRLAELEGRTNDAVRIYFEIMQFNRQSAHGGLLFSELVALSGEFRGLLALRQISGGLDAETCRSVIAKLVSTRDNRDPPGEVVDREIAFHDCTYTLGERFHELMVTHRTSQWHADYHRLIQRRSVLQRQTGQLILILAERAYSLEHGGAPKSASDLVPDYLKFVPQDPLTGTKMVLADKP